jgi:hypothetical protein
MKTIHYVLILFSGLTLGLIAILLSEKASEVKSDNPTTTIGFSSRNNDDFSFKKFWYLDREVPSLDDYIVNANWVSQTALLKDVQQSFDLRQKKDNNPTDYILDAMTIGLKDKYMTDSLMQLDTFVNLMQWAISLHISKDVLPEDESRVFRIISNFWLNQLSNQIVSIYDNDNAIKDDDKFKYIIIQLHSRGFYPAIGSNLVDKFFNNLSRGNFEYILSRFWGATNWKIKLLALIFLLYNIYAIWCIVKVNQKSY